MSSLLDILHRKDSRAEPDAAPADPAPESATQTVELRLAIDNGPLEPPEQLSTATEPAFTPSPDTATTVDPFATRLLTAAQLQQRSRRSSVWLGTGLVLIVLAAGTATWLLNQIKVDGADNDSLFTARGSEPALPVAASAPISQAPPEAGPQKPAAAPQAPAPAKPASTDTAWFDAPATEETAGFAGDSPAQQTADGSAEPIRILRGSTTNPLFARLSEAWTAFQNADYQRAESLYREVRAADPGNVDALLGLGALAARGNRTAEAREMYQAALLAEPRNPTAISALSTLPGAAPGQLGESALKSLLREQPNAANLHFALGLQYVTDGRWPDAQIAFFEAVRNEPTNADYAYNLAVSLDRLSQAGPAAAYYQRALDLATASTLFNPGIAQARLNTLRSAATQATAQ